MANLVTTDDNEKLLQRVHDSEVKDAIFQKDKSKALDLMVLGQLFFKIIGILLKRKFALRSDPSLRRGSY